MYFDLQHRYSIHIVVIQILYLSSTNTLVFIMEGTIERCYGSNSFKKYSISENSKEIY
jgi:hypothetical protein